MNKHVFDPPISSANASIWAIVCGYAPLSRRQNHKIVVLRAYIDDSLESDSALIMAGYISSAERWAKFSDEWQHGLDMRLPYPITAYHSSDGRTSEEERERQVFLYRAIEANVIAAICCCIRIAPVKKWCADYNLEKEFENPYLWAIKGVVNLVAQDQRKIGIDEPIDFVFDERGEKKYLIHGWDYYKNSIPKEVRDVTGSMPLFQDDEKVLPLQAADMLAWHMLQLYRQERTIMQRKFPFPWAGKINYPMFGFEPTDRDIKRNIWQLKKNLADDLP